MKAICNCGKELIFDKEVNEWACVNCGYMYDEFELIDLQTKKGLEVSNKCLKWKVDF